ncbi:MAG: fibronectin type III domain-containing protein, partial [Calditrichota bacterium]
WRPGSGLFNRHIALWPSHGWYYDYGKQRWDWQRARVYQTVEDLLPLAFIQPYLLPMLENAGANVFLPRERDIQTHEVIVDETLAIKSGEWQIDNSGFAIPDSALEAGDNPFQSGTALYTTSDSITSQSLQYIPDIPQTGRYAVSIAYRSDSTRATDVEYIVNHAGGRTTFQVNQQIGGSTWIYLGTFKFPAGTHPDSGSVLLTNKSSKKNQTISADAVRFGGGMGSVARNGQTSGRPRYMEGARYYMQYSGMPDTLVYNVTESPKSDYKDDYRGRGEWVNYLAGAPFGPNKARNTKGLGIPIDASLAFHTDAGTTRDGSVIGTLMIYSETGGDTTQAFPDSMSRMANRDMADIMQSQIVSDLKYLFNPNWKRRSIWDSRYSEAFRPNVPSVLLELLSHHNFEDMKYALDPRFRFYASRAIYKGLLKFISTQNQQPYVVQPLPVSHFQMQFIDNGLQLKWSAVEDALEPSASPTGYILYTRIEDGGWDNGVLLEQPTVVLSELLPNTIYSFKITAVNDGGESFPSEI